MVFVVGSNIYLGISLFYHPAYMGLAIFVLPSKTCFGFAIPGYFAVDEDSTPEKLVFNRTVTLKDSYSKGGK